MDDHRINPDALYAPKQICELEHCSLATVYIRLGRGEYSAVKDGRKTLIPGSEILARRRNKLKPARFKSPPPPPAARFHTIVRRKPAEASTP